MALVIQHAKRARRIILSSVNCVALRYFFLTLSRKRHDFRAGFGVGGGVLCGKEFLNVKLCCDFSTTVV